MSQLSRLQSSEGATSHTSVTTFSITDLVIKTLIHYFTERFSMISPAVDSTPAPRHTQTL